MKCTQNEMSTASMIVLQKARSQPTAYSLQPTAYSLQPTASSLQPTAYSLQPTAYIICLQYCGWVRSVIHNKSGCIHLHICVVIQIMT